MWAPVSGTWSGVFRMVVHSMSCFFAKTPYGQCLSSIGCKVVLVSEHYLDITTHRRGRLCHGSGRMVNKLTKPWRVFEQAYKATVVAKGAEVDGIRQGFVEHVHNESCAESPVPGELRKASRCSFAVRPRGFSSDSARRFRCKRGGVPEHSG